MKTASPIDATGHNLLACAHKVFDSQIEALAYVRNKLGPSFPMAVEAIQKANAAILFGVGKSGLIGAKIAATFASIGVAATSVHPVDALHGDIGIVRNGDCAIIISKSGSNEEILRLLPSLRKRGAQVIAIVGNPHSPLGKFADIVLDAGIQSEGGPHNLAPMASSTAALVLGDALAAALMAQSNFSAEDFAALHPMGHLGRILQVSVEEAMHKGDALPRALPTATFRETIIQITEKQLGCCCVLDPTGVLVGVITDGDVRRALQNNGEIDRLSAADVMTAKPVTIRPDALIGAALALMENRSTQISVLPVVNDEHICVGVIRVHDIVRIGG